LKEGWSQRKQGKILRVCCESKCKKYFHCTGECGDDRRLRYIAWCTCPDCVDDAILWNRREECPAYKDLDIGEIFYRCYGFRREGDERGMEPSS